VLPLVERHVFASEWLMMESHAVSAIGPQYVALVIGMALYERGEEIVLEEPRAELLPVAPGVYADYAERVHGTRTPPRAKEVVLGAPCVGAAYVASVQGKEPAYRYPPPGRSASPGRHRAYAMLSRC